MTITYFVTLNWNTTDYLKKLAASVRETVREPYVWIIIDNGSDEVNQVELYDWAHRFFDGDIVILGDSWHKVDKWNPEDIPDNPDAIIIRSDENLGCILAHNMAFDAARLLSNGEPHEIVMVDTDVELLERDWLSEVRAWADARPRVGIVGLEHSAAEKCAGAVFLDPSGNWYLHQGQTFDPTPVEGESVGLGLALIRWPVLQAGLRFDTKFKLYYKQDDDFCFQVRADLGLEVWAYPIMCVHWGSGSLKQNEYKVGEADGWTEFDQIKQTNQAYFAAKWQWALCDRRANLEQETTHLAAMKAQMKERRQDHGQD